MSREGNVLEPGDQFNRDVRVSLPGRPWTDSDTHVHTECIQKALKTLLAKASQLSSHQVGDIRWSNPKSSKRWVVVRPAGGVTGTLLARAGGDHQAAPVGKQFAGRVGFFLRVDDFESAYRRMVAAGVAFAS
jgi:hypothetical protein